MTLGRAILFAHLKGDRCRRNMLMRAAIRRGVTIRELAVLLTVATSTVHGWVGRRDRIIGEPLRQPLDELGLPA